jgi:hypothetical protein
MCAAAHAQPKSVRAAAACDKLAASDFDPTRPASVRGVPLAAIDARPALDICAFAVKAEPRNARLVFQLGRAFRAAERQQEARKALRLAIALGNKPAAAEYADLLAQGIGGPRDPAQARRNYERAAAGGDPDAMLALARMYESGAGVNASPALARRWGEQAARDLQRRAANSAQANYLLFEVYRGGHGVAANPTASTQYLTAAARQGHPQAVFALAENAERAGDLAKAREWYIEGGKAGNAASMVKLALLYEKGGTPRHRDVAKKLYELAAAQGDRNAQAQLRRLQGGGR